MRAPDSHKVYSPLWFQEAGSLTAAGKPFTEEQKEAIRKRLGDLAILQPEEEAKLLKHLELNYHFSAGGQPGSGKTIELIRILVRWATKPILLVLSRRAQSVATVEYLQVILGVDPKDENQSEIIVLRNGNNNNHPEHETRVVVVTEGIALREALRDVKLDKYSAVIFDQVQEESGTMEVLMALAKWSMTTSNSVRFGFIGSNYDFSPLRQYLNLPLQSHFTFPARIFPLHITYSPTPVTDLGEWVVQRLAAFIKQRRGDVIIFASGHPECEDFAKRIRSANISEPLNIFVISAKSSIDDRKRATAQPRRNAKRRVIISTVILQNGITIPRLALVIDPSTSMLAVHDPKGDRRGPISVPAARSTADQRAGCVGRTQPGYVERPIPEAMFQQSRWYPEPRVLHEVYTETLLANLAITEAIKGQVRGSGLTGHLLALRNNAPLALRSHALTVLDSLGAIRLTGVGHAGSTDTTRVKLTKIGWQMARLTASPEYARALIASVDFGCVDHMAALVAVNSIPQDIFLPAKSFNMKDPRQASRRGAQRTLMLPGLGDHFSPLNALLKCWQAERSTKFAENHGLCLAAYVEASEVANALRVQMRMPGMYRGHVDRTNSKEPDVEALSKSLVYGHLHMIAQRGAGGSYRRLGGNRGLLTTKNPSRLRKSKQRYLLFSTAHKADRQPEVTIIKDITPIEEAWIDQAGTDIRHKASLS